MLCAPTFFTTTAKKPSISLPLLIPAIIRFIPSSLSCSSLLSSSLDISLIFSSDVAVSKYFADVDVLPVVKSVMSRVVSCGHILRTVPSRCTRKHCDAHESSPVYEPATSRVPPWLPAAGRSRSPARLCESMRMTSYTIEAIQPQRLTFGGGKFGSEFHEIVKLRGFVLHSLCNF